MAITWSARSGWIALLKGGSWWPGDGALPMTLRRRAVRRASAGFGAVRSIVDRVVASGRAPGVAAATFEGRETIRICVTHGETGLAISTSW